MTYIKFISKKFGIKQSDFLKLIIKYKIPFYIHAIEAEELSLRPPMDKIHSLIKKMKQEKYSDYLRRFDQKIDKFITTDESITRSFSYEDLYAEDYLMLIPISFITIFYKKDFSTFFFKGKIYKISATNDQIATVNYYIDQCKLKKEKLDKFQFTPSEPFNQTKKKQDAVFYTNIIVKHLKAFFRVSPRNRTQIKLVKNRPKYIFELISDEDFFQIQKFLSKTK